MNGDDTYRAWKKRRSSVEPAEGFADGVMERIRQHRRRAAFSAAGAFARRLWPGVAAAGVVLLGFLIGISRIVFVVHLIIGLCREGA